MNKQTKWIILIFGFAIVMWWLFYSPHNYSPPNEETEYNQVYKYSLLYKQPLNFEGYHYCNFVFDWDKEAYAKEMSYVFGKFCNLSKDYPLIKEFLYNEYKLDIIDSSEWQTAAWYSGNGNILINKQFAKAKNFDLYLSHEIAHSSTEGLNLPDWLNEGIAEYASYRFFGTQFKLNALWFGEGFERWNPNNATIGENIRGYTHAGYVVRSFVEKYGDDTFKNLLKNLVDKINYDDDTGIKNQKVLVAVQTVTGNSSITLQNIIHP